MAGARVAPEPLALACTRHWATPMVVDGLRRLSGGASRETWAFDAREEATGVRHALVLRRDPGGHNAGSTGRDVEFELLRAANTAGVPVPTVQFLLTPKDELGEGFVMDLIEGETIPRRILRDEEFAAARPQLAAQCGAIAAGIHATPTAALPELPVQRALDQVAQYRSILDAFKEPHPVFELGLRWLEEHAGSPSDPVLVHGDFRNGNFIVGPEGIRAVLDWELAHLGDPIEDLGWLCVKSWRFGITDRPVGGFGTYDDLRRAYDDASGRSVEADELRYWEAFGTLKWGVICEVQCFTHLHGMVRSVELAALGRRIAETEWDLLDLIA